MRKIFLTVLAAAALVSCAKNSVEMSGSSGTLKIDGQSVSFVSALTRADGQKELAELGESVPDPMSMRTLISCKSPDIRLDGSNPWKVYSSANAANEENPLYEPADYIVTIGTRTESGILPHYTELSTGKTVTNTERPYYTGGSVLIPQTPEGKNLPYFEGRAEVTVNKGETATAHVSLRVANTAVCVRFTDNFKKYFEKGATILIKTKSAGPGTDKMTAANTFTVTYDTDEGAIFWIRPQGFSISGTALRQDPSPGIIEAKPVGFADYTVKDEAVKPQTLYTYTFDIAGAGSTGSGPDEAGGITITINDEPVEIIEDDIELNPNAPKN